MELKLAAVPAGNISSRNGPKKSPRRSDSRLVGHPHVPYSATSFLEHGPMALIDLWRDSRAQISSKHVQQIVAFAGDGKLADGNSSSSEFRAFLGQIPSEMLVRYTTECLVQSFNGSGLVLQDIVNEAGARLGFKITPGRYRGVVGQLGFDGLWESADGHSIVVEVKTTDAYTIDLNTIANYRRRLVKEGTISEEHSSVLIVVGRDDTGALEAQIRGSRHAWDVRLISTEALMSLLAVKEDVEDPQTQSRIHSVLRPREFTRLDEIVELLFSTAEDIKQEQVVEEDELEEDEEKENETDFSPEWKPKFVPVAFHDACIRRIEKVLGISLLKRSRATFAGADKDLRLICAISREHVRGGTRSYWFAFHPHQGEYLAGGVSSYVAFGCGSEHQLLLIRYEEFQPWLNGMNETTTKDRTYKHVSIFQTDNRFELVRRQGWPRIDLTPYLVKD